jgi:hypothetical protein
MKQTAVEWLYEQIENKDMGEIPMWVYEFIEQSKEMEKENTINFAIQCMFSTKDIGSNLKNDFFIKKYNETFKSK